MVLKVLSGLSSGTAEHEFKAVSVRLLHSVTRLESCRRERKRNLEAGPPELWGGARRDASVMGDDDLQGERQAQAGARALGGEERPENPVAGGRVDAGAVVLHRNPAHALFRV